MSTNMSILGQQCATMGREEMEYLIRESTAALGGAVKGFEWRDEGRFVVVVYEKGPVFANFKEMIAHHKSTIPSATPTQTRQAEKRAEIAAKFASPAEPATEGYARFSPTTHMPDKEAQDPAPYIEPFKTEAPAEPLTKEAEYAKYMHDDQFEFDPSMGAPQEMPSDAMAVMNKAAAEEEGKLTLGIKFGDPKSFDGWEQLTPYNYESEEWRSKSNKDRAEFLIRLCVKENPNVRIGLVSEDGRPSAQGLSGAQQERQLSQNTHSDNKNMKIRAARIQAFNKMEENVRKNGPIRVTSDTATTMSRAVLSEHMGEEFKSKGGFEVMKGDHIFREK